MPAKRKDATLGVAGDHEGQPEGSLTTPIHQTSTFIAPTTAAFDDIYEGRREGYVYSRYANPTLDATARKIALLEEADGAVLTASGMAATVLTTLAFTKAGGRVLAVEDLYGGTAGFFATTLARFGVTVEKFPTRDTKALERLLASGPADLVWLETPTNPTLKLADLKEVARAARAAGVPTAVDSTFASPVNSKPRRFGIDVVMHSATKYLGGHSDLTAGVVAASGDHLARLKTLSKSLGATLDPHAAFLLDRGLKTLAVRVKQENASALHLAEELERHPKISRVNYPGLATHPQHALAKAQMPGGFGGLLSFDVKPGTKAAAAAFVDHLGLVRNAASLGGVESLVSIPVVQSHRGQSAGALAAQGISPGTVRLAVGLEDVSDVWADLEQALMHV